MSTATFVDTAAWYALADSGDSAHAVAVRHLARIRAERQPLVTTNYVVAETYTLIRQRGGHAVATMFLTHIKNDRTIRRTHVTEAWEQEAERLLEQYADQDFSYVDATSFVAMRRLGITQAFTFDHHFLVAGFTLTGS